MRWFRKAADENGQTGQKEQLLSKINAHRKDAYSCQKMGRYDDYRGVDKQKYYKYDYTTFIDDRKEYY